MKIRFVFSAFCMLVAMTMATGAFAQATFQVSSGATQGRMNGHTEEAGGITLAVTSGTIADAQTGRCSSITASRSRMRWILRRNNMPVTWTSVASAGENDANTEIDGNTITVTVVDGAQSTVNVPPR